MNNPANQQVLEAAVAYRNANQALEDAYGRSQAARSAPYRAANHALAFCANDCIAVDIAKAALNRALFALLLATDDTGVTA